MNVGKIKATVQKDVIDGDKHKAVREVAKCARISKSSVQPRLTSQLERNVIK